MFALSSCNKENDNALDTSWIVGTWQATELVMNVSAGDMTEDDTSNLEEMTDVVVGTIKFTADGKASVLVDFVQDDDNDIAKEYDYSIGKENLKVGDYDLKYEYDGTHLKVYGHGLFIYEIIDEVDTSNLTPEQIGQMKTMYTFKKL